MATKEIIIERCPEGRVLTTKVIEISEKEEVKKKSTPKSKKKDS